MPGVPEKTWAELKLEGRARYFDLVNVANRKAWSLKWLLHGALIRACKDPREIREALRPFFPDAWSTPSRWYMDKQLEDKRAQAFAWMHGRPVPVSNTLLDRILSWSNPNKEYR